MLSALPIQTGVAHWVLLVQNSRHTVCGVLGWLDRPDHALVAIKDHPWTRTEASVVVGDHDVAPQTMLLSAGELAQISHGVLIDTFQLTDDRQTWPAVIGYLDQDRLMAAYSERILDLKEG